MPLNVALTGNVAAGKSAVTAWFASWGATVIDADVIVRELQAPGSPILDQIVSAFGDGVLRRDGSLDRAAVRARMLRDDEARRHLNHIVHPAVAARRDQLMREAADRGDAVVVNDIPLLFEALDPAAFDMIVLVDAPAAVRRRRLVETRGIPTLDAERLIAAQLPAEGKRSRSHAVIDNDTDLDELERRAWAVWEDIRTRAARHGYPRATSRTLLAVFAHPDDEAIALGGTLARYADAGVAIQLLCATAGEAATGTDLTPDAVAAARRADLHRSARALGIERVEILGWGDGTLVPHDPAATAAIGNVIARLQPDVILTFGPDGITGHADHRAVHSWTTGAHAQSAPASELLYVGYPDTLATRTPREVVCRSADDLAVRIDIRPWADRKRAAIAAHQTVPYRVPETRAAVETLFEREWFAPESGRPTHRSEVFPDAR